MGYFWLQLVYSSTGEATPETLFENHAWTIDPLNKGCEEEPRVVTADYVKDILPEIKIIAMIREPTAR